MEYNRIAMIKDSDKKQVDTKSISILYVDDEKENLRVLSLLMRKKFKILSV